MFSLRVLPREVYCSAESVAAFSSSEVCPLPSLHYITPLVVSDSYAGHVLPYRPTKFS